MDLSPDIKEYIDRSVLCWLATASGEGQPNVSPKEIFRYFGDDAIIVANIASPQTVRNIRKNPQVCISFIDILVQKGYQLKGRAHIVRKADPEFPAMEKALLEMTMGKFPFASIIHIRIDQAKPILAPRYRLYPDTTEAEQIARSKKAYGLG